jgi:hypothetical protein
MFVSSPRGDEWDPLISYGITLRYYLTEGMAIGTDLRHTLVYRSGFQSDYEAGIGLTFVVGGERKFKRIPAPKATTPQKPVPAIKRLDQVGEDADERIEGPRK